MTVLHGNPEPDPILEAVFAPPVPTRASFQQLELPLPGFFPFFLFLINNFSFFPFLVFLTFPHYNPCSLPQVVQ